MAPDYTVYLNGSYFDSLSNSDAFSDRPEPYRRQERSLWIICQLLKLGTHEFTITTAAKQLVFRTSSADDFCKWVEQVYPNFGFVKQFQQPTYTRFPHPADQL